MEWHICHETIYQALYLGRKGGLSRPGRWVEILNTDSTQFGGSGITVGDLTAEAIGWNDLEYSASMTLPPLGVVWLAHQG